MYHNIILYVTEYHTSLEPLFRSDIYTFVMRLEFAMTRIYRYLQAGAYTCIVHTQIGEQTVGTVHS